MTSTGPKKARMEEQILAEAARLFAKKGVEGTSLTDIAKALGMTRGAIYYYFENKEALLDALVAGLAELAVQEIEIWRRTATGSPAERLKSLAELRIRSILTRGIQFRILATAENILPPELRRRHVAAMNRVYQEYRSIIRDGILSGDFRMGDEHVMALTLSGVVTSTAWWYYREENPDPDKIVEELAEFAVRGLLREGASAAREPTIESLFSGVRSELDFLEHFVSNKINGEGK